MIHYPDPNLSGQSEDLRVIYYLPEYVWIHDGDTIKVGVWDLQEKQWNTDVIENLSFDIQAKQLSYTTTKLAPMAFLQARITDYPYKFWFLRATSDETAILDIHTKRLVLSFEIGAEYLMLIDRTEAEFSHIVGQKLSPGFLLNELMKCGLNIMPVDQDAEEAGIKLKDRDAEHRAIIDICTSVRSFYFKSCVWNTAAEPENIIVKIKENLEHDRIILEDHEPDWRYI